MIPKKSLGQNFLMHPQTAERIVQAADVPDNIQVLEIGPGKGMLTRALLATGHRVIAVEADGELVAHLEENFIDAIAQKKLTIIHEDIRTFDIGTHIKSDYALVANIPYYITGEIIRSFLSSAHKPTSMTLLVQKEVAERITRAKKESLLSLSVKAYGTPEYCFTVPKGAFVPAPKVDSAVISIRDIRKDAFQNMAQEQRFFEIIRAGFAHKRKFVTGNLTDVALEPDITRAFAATNVPPKARAEDLSLTDWQNLLHALS